jgi:hypothetical protein
VNRHLEIPGHERAVSSVAVVEGTLVLRLVSDIHPGTDAAAYELKVHQIERSEQVLSFLAGVKERNEYIYLQEKDGVVSVATEDGDEVTLTGGHIDGSAERLNATEFSRAFARVYSWFEAESISNRDALRRLSQIRGLLVEQARRIEVKAGSHSPGSAAGILYSQQLQFIRRVLRETET